LVVDTVTVLEHLVQAWENTDDVTMTSAPQTALYLAQIAEGDGETVRTSRRTHNINWNATPERLFLKCVLGALIRKGLPKSELLARFKKLVPEYQHFFDSPVSDNAMYGRADTGRRGGKYRENPDIHPLTQPYWPLALKAVEDDQPLSADAVRKLVHGDEEQEEVAPASDREECAPVTEQGNDTGRNVIAEAQRILDNSKTDHS
jgi:hypothetical protein